jgi:molybdate-binding protein/transcriptional regulator with XRE-family HTH domain
MISGTRLRFSRQARGFSQQQLAGMAGISRQAVSAVESGQSDPSLRVALALAQALGMTVEELFGAESAIPSVSASLVGHSGPDDATSPVVTRVTLAPIGDSFVALPLAGATVSRAGFLPAGGLLASGQPGQPGQPSQLGQRSQTSQRRGATEPQLPATACLAEVKPMGPPRPTLVVAGCDPALPLLEEPLSLLDPPIAFSWWPCSSREALRLAADGLVHAAGAHLRDQSGEYNTGAAAELLAAGGEVIGFSAWREGLVLGPAAAASVTGMADVASRGLRLVNREPGAEARRVLDRELGRAGIDGELVAGYRTMAAGHLQVADAIAAGLADAGVACEPAALAHGLAFIPLAAERFDLVIPSGHAASREVQALIKVLASRWLIDQLASLPGYDPSSCGQHLATLPAS